MIEQHWKFLLESRLLSKREKYCAIVSAQYALGQRKEAFEIIRTAVKSGDAPLKLFVELFIHLSLFLGFPAMLDGLETLQRLNGVVSPQKRKRARGRSRSEGMRIFRRIYGPQTDKVLKNLHGIHPDIARWIIKDAYGKIFNRQGMLLKERELVNVVVLGIQGFTPQFFSHVRGALRVGMKAKSMEAILDFISISARLDARIARRILLQAQRTSSLAGFR